VHEICSVFASAIQRTYRRTARGQAEEQLKRPVSELIEAVGHRAGQEVETTPEIVAAEGRPDIGVLRENLLCRKSLSSGKAGTNSRSVRG
jgi:hypothetical protein